MSSQGGFDRRGALSYDKAGRQVDAGAVGHSPRARVRTSRVACPAMSTSVGSSSARDRSASRRAGRPNRRLTGPRGSAVQFAVGAVEAERLQVALREDSRGAILESQEIIALLVDAVDMEVAVQDEGRVDFDLGVFQCSSVAVGACPAAPHSRRATIDGEASVSEFEEMVVGGWRRSHPTNSPTRSLGARASVRRRPR